MSKYILFFFIVFFHCEIIISQTPNENLDNLIYNMNLSGNSVSENKYIKIEGSPYLFSDYKEASITLKTDTSFKLLMKYDLYIDNFEYKHGNKTYLIDKKTDIKEIVISGKTFVYYNNPDYKSFDGFYQVYRNGSYSLLSKRYVEYQEEIKGNGIILAEPPKFVPKKEIFYIFSIKSIPQQIKNRKSLINCFPDKTAEIKKFIKSNKISPNNTDDILSVIEYYEKLQLEKS